MEVVNDLLGYDGLKIIQRPDMFHFSIDSMLLGYFAPITKKTERIMDLCTGNAPVAMYLTLRTSAKIEGVEIQDEVFDLAKRSIELNGLEQQIHLYHRNLIGLHKDTGHDVYDLVTCNPPFFKLNEDSNLPSTDYKTIARHEVSATLEDIIVEAKRLLKNKGVFYFVHRPDRLSDILLTLKKHKMYPKSLRFVYPKQGTNANAVLVSAQKGMKDGFLNVLEPLFVHEGNTYSKAVRDIFFYRKDML